ncbi:MAG: DUF362 domain-containing protein [Candidatus Bathyarchaeota archaeon]|nr:DUF362 domain-containing protein [Candidatus Bathyarchaeota archaeon]
MSLVSLVKINNVNQRLAYKQAIAEALDLIGYTFKGNIKTVVIKPNLCYYLECSTGQTTDPKFVADLIDLIREKTYPTIDISIIESDASAMRCKHVDRMLGYEQLAQEKNVKLINLSEEDATPATVSCNQKSYTFNVPKIIQNADLKIDIAKIKYTVDPVKLTCALKNIYGCNPYKKKYEYHTNLGNVIVALNKAMRFNLFLIDNNIASGVQPRRLGLTMASLDPVALDVACAQIAWLNPEKIPYFKTAEKEGVGSREFLAKGAPLEDFKALYPKKAFRSKFMGLVLKVILKVGLGKRMGLE